MSSYDYPIRLEPQNIPEELHKDMDWQKFYVYEKHCVCGKLHSLVHDRKNEFSGYRTNTMLLCKCGQYTLFKLPVG